MSGSNYAVMLVVWHLATDTQASKAFESNDDKHESLALNVWQVFSYHVMKGVINCRHGLQSCNLSFHLPCKIQSKSLRLLDPSNSMPILSYIY